MSADPITSIVARNLCTGCGACSGSFPGLIRMIAGQQVSVQSARALIARLAARVDPLTAEQFLETSEEDLRAAGLSRPKMRYGRILAEEIAEGRRLYRARLSPGAGIESGFFDHALEEFVKKQQLRFSGT